MGQVKGGAMAAILNAPAGAALMKFLRKSFRLCLFVDVAKFMNSPAQVGYHFGDEPAVAKAGELLMEAVARRVVPLAVSGAFHSESFLEDAGERFY